jgi:hypothetical protein
MDTSENFLLPMVGVDAFSFMQMFLFCLAICKDGQGDQKDECQPERHSHIDHGTEQHKKCRNDDEY